MEETGLSEEEVIEGLGSFLRGPSKEEQSENKAKLEAKIEEITRTATEKGWENIGYLYEKEKLESAEALMGIAAKNKYRGTITAVPHNASGTLYIVYKKGLTGLQKMASGSGGLTGGK